VEAVSSSSAASSTGGVSSGADGADGGSPVGLSLGAGSAGLPSDEALEEDLGFRTRSSKTSRPDSELSLMGGFPSGACGGGLERGPPGNAGAAGHRSIKNHQ